MATHSSILAWKIPWTEKPGNLQSMGSQRVGHDWATSLSLWPHKKTQNKRQSLTLHSFTLPLFQGGVWTLCDPVDYSLPGSSFFFFFSDSSVHGIFQARVLEWVAIAFSRRSSWPRDQIPVFCTVVRFFTNWATRKAWYQTFNYIYTDIICIPERKASACMSLKALDYGYRETSTNSGHFWALVGRPQVRTEVKEV